MNIEHEPKLDYSDVLIKPKRSTLKSRSEVSLERTYTFRNSGRTWTGVPIIASNMFHTGTYAVAKILEQRRCLTAFHKFHTINSEIYHSDIDWTYGIVSTGITDSDNNKLEYILKHFTNVKMICVDVANGYTEMFSNYIRNLRLRFPHITIMAGNVVTGDMTQELILSGADIIKTGIGPGSVCTTRIKTGVGYPQLSAVMECADAAHGLGGHICADGGCVNSGDVAKAFGAGADFVMLGGMFAGHNECEGSIISEDGKDYMEFYGMSSAEAQARHGDGLKEYRASEGKMVKVPYRGHLEQTISDILGGVRSTCTYVGAKRLKDLSKCTTFIRVNNQNNKVFG